MPLRLRAPSLLAACGVAVAACLTAPPAATAVDRGAPTARPAADSARGLAPFLEPAAARLELADKVAAAKWGTDSPIDDPARERVVLDDAAARARTLGVDPDEARAVFRDQIEAGKIVQRGLHARWRAHPDERPTRRPDLDKEVRPRLDELTGTLLGALRDTRSVRSHAACPVHLAYGTARTVGAAHLDALHAGALLRAEPALCD